MKPQLDGLVCRLTEPARLPQQLADALRAALLYAALCAAVCSMASLSTLGLLPLAPGLLTALVLPLLPQRRILRLAQLAVLLAALVLALARLEATADGLRALLGRLFAASEAKQAYLYDTLPLAAQALWKQSLQWLLLCAGLPLGLLSALACTRARWLLPLTALALAALIAWLGVAPAPEVCVLLALALLAAFAIPSPSGTLRLLPAVLVPLLLACALVHFALPGEDLRLSAWEEDARDALAYRTAAWADPQTQLQTAPPPTAQQTQQQTFYLPEQTPTDLGGDETVFPRPPRVLLAILLFALALFLPAILSDRLRKRQFRNRQGLDDPDNAASVRAAFLYALRWLQLAGLQPQNQPHSAYGAQIEALAGAQLRAEYEAAVPLWQLAAYSTHTLDETQREQMRAFLLHTQRGVWQRLSRRKRFAAKYIHAL